MILGRRYSRFKRRIGDSTVVIFEHKETGKETAASRKFKMLYVLAAFEGLSKINEKALKREYVKMINQIESKED
jgi:hypothetical protein